MRLKLFVQILAPETVNQERALVFVVLKSDHDDLKSRRLTRRDCWSAGFDWIFANPADKAAIWAAAEADDEKPVTWSRKILLKAAKRRIK